MIYQIKRGTTVIASVRPEGEQERSAMAVDRVAMRFTLPSPVEFRRGDTVEVYGLTYKLNRPANENQSAEKLGYQYDLEFEALYYDLAKWQLRGLGPNNQLTESTVYVTGTAATIVDLVVRNANRVSSGWTIGVVDITDVRQFTYVNQSLLAVLQDLADTFETEFWVENKTIHLQKRESSSGLTLEFGMGKGLYELFRGRTDTDVINRLYVEGGSTNLPNNYGFTRLQLPAANRPYISSAQPGEEIIEHTEYFENIFPNRTGTITALGSDDLTFVDTSIDFDLNPLTGTEKVSFTSGLLASFEFAITSYNHSTKTFRIARITDDKAYPNGVPYQAGGLIGKVGDQYVFLGIQMPQSYVTAAENRLLQAGQSYLNANNIDRYEYKASLSPIFVKREQPNIVLGNTVVLLDTPRGINKTIRISGYTRDLQEEARYTNFELKDTITPSEYARQYAQQEKIIYALQNSGLLDPSLGGNNSLFLNRLSESNGYLLLGNQKIKSGFADYAQEAGTAMTANYATTAGYADEAGIADYARDSDKWDGFQFADYMNQPVRTGDSPRFAGTGSPSFFSGFAGSGWRIENVNGNVSATFDNLTVRKEMNIYELIINQIRATNGSLWVTDSIKIIGVTVSGSNYVCTIDTDNNSIAVPFVANDLIRCQKWTGRNVKYYTARVVSIGTGTFTITRIDGSGVPAANDEVVRVGSTTNSARQNAIYLTASDNNNPYIDILAGVNGASFEGKTVARLGNLSGITSPIWGALTGYGIWTNRGYFENVNVSGSITVTGGNAATQQYAQTQASNAQSNAIANATAQIAAIQIGGTNLIPNYSKLDTLTGWSTNLGGTSVVTDSGRNVVQVASTASGSGIFRNLDIIAYKTGVEYTVSVDVKAVTDTATVLIGWNLGTQKTVSINAAMGWQRISVTSSDPKTHITLYSFGGGAQTFLLRNVKVEEGNKASDYSPSPQEVSESIDAAQTQANNAFNQAQQANNQLADIASDSKLTPVEKKQTKVLFDEIVQERPKIIAQAGQYSVSTTAYTNAFNTLNSYISPLLSNLNTTSDIVRNTFQTRFSDYYDARELLLQAIVTAAKTYTNTQITDAKSYADQVAQSQAQIAQAAAIQAASTDATNKANAARSQAEQYSVSLVNSINVGAVNIMPGNTALTSLSGWTVNIGGATMVADSGRQVVQITGSTPGMGIFRSTGSLLEVGKEYTIGIDIKSTASTSSVNFGTHNTGSRIISVPSSSGWTRYYYTFVATNTSISIICYINGTQTATFLVKNVKLETGNKGTDWSPNPAETQASIDAAQSAANSAQQAYNTLTSQLKSMAYKDVVQLADLGTTVISNGKIVTTLIDAAWIQANVVNAGYLSSVTFSLNSGTINNLVGNNAFINSLTANTGFINNLTANNAFMQSVVVGGGGATVSDLNNMQVGGRNQALSTSTPLVFTGTGANNETAISYFYNSSIAGQKITVSFDWQVAQNASFPSNGIFRFQNNGTPDFSTFSEVITPYAQGRSGKSKYTFTAPAYTGSATTLRLRLRSDFITGQITIRNFKAEIGDKATDWTPAPEDIQADISMAQNNAINTAAADATAKANAARDAAIANANAKIGPLPSGQTIIATVGGVAYIKTDLINVAQIFAQNVTATGQITATNFNLQQGNAGFLNVDANRLWIGNKDTWTPNTNVISLLSNQFILRKNGSSTDQTRELIYYPELITGTLISKTVTIKNNIGASGYTNIALSLEAGNGDGNVALEIATGGIKVGTWTGATENVTAGSFRMRFVNGIYCGTWN